MCVTLGDSDLLTIFIALTMFVSLIILRMYPLYISSKVKLKNGMANVFYLDATITFLPQVFFKCHASEKPVAFYDLICAFCILRIIVGSILII